MRRRPEQVSHLLAVHGFARTLTAVAARWARGAASPCWPRSSRPRCRPSPRRRRARVPGARRLGPARDARRSRRYREALRREARDALGPCERAVSDSHRPAKTARSITRLRFFTEDKRTEVYLVLSAVVDADNDIWLRVRIPRRPNGQTGWVPVDMLSQLHVVRTQLVINRKTLRGRCTSPGAASGRRGSGVGKASMPTRAASSTSASCSRATASSTGPGRSARARTRACRTGPTAASSGSTALISPASSPAARLTASNTMSQATRLRRAPPPPAGGRAGVTKRVAWRRRRRRGRGWRWTGPPAAGGPALGVPGVGEPADDVLRPVAAVRDVQRAARDAHVAGRHVAERGGHERRRGHRAVRQHRAVVEQGADPLSEAGVGHADDDPRVGVQLLDAQRRVDVADLAVADQRDRARRLRADLAERLVVEVLRLVRPDLGQPGDLRAVVAFLRREDDGDVLAVARGQLVGEPEGQRRVAADDEVPACRGAAAALSARRDPSGSRLRRQIPR